MIRWFLVTLARRHDGLTLNGIDTYGSKETCDAMGQIAAAWFGVDWACVMQLIV